MSASFNNRFNTRACLGISLESMSLSSCLIRGFERSLKCHFHIQPTFVNGFEKLWLMKSCVANIFMSADFFLHQSSFGFRQRFSMEEILTFAIFMIVAMNKILTVDWERRSMIYKSMNSWPVTYTVTQCNLYMSNLIWLSSHTSSTSLVLASFGEVGNKAMCIRE